MNREYSAVGESSDIVGEKGGWNGGRVGVVVRPHLFLNKGVDEFEMV